MVATESAILSSLALTSAISGQNGGGARWHVTCIRCLGSNWLNAVQPALQRISRKEPQYATHREETAGDHLDRTERQDQVWNLRLVDWPTASDHFARAVFQRV